MLIRIGLYALELKEDNRFIGFVGFHNIADNMPFAPAIEISWRICFDAWNKGYATEAASACLKYAGEKLKLKEICSFTSIPNKRSERVMQKIGMHKVGEFDHPEVPDGHILRKHVLYKINLEQDINL